MHHLVSRQPLVAAAAVALGALAIMTFAQTPPNDDAPDSGRQAAQQDAPPPAGAEVATFASGCFWCTEAVFQDLRGVAKVVSGYTGGDAASASYKVVSSGQTKHAEAVQVHYDPNEVDYATLLEVFWKTHDPTTPNRQGADVGPQYRSAIFYHDDQQQRLAQEYKAKLDKTGAFDGPIVTEIVPFESFFPAEDYHQNYFALNPQQGYCRAVIGPKLEKFRKVFGDKLKNAPKKSEGDNKPKSGKPGTAESKAELKQRLSDLQWFVTQESGTERPFQNMYWNKTEAGDYKCVVCGELLFTSDEKFDSGCGWPSFTKTADQDAVTEVVDNSHGMRRTEIRCTKCGAHLGHVFDDGPVAAGGLRYCLNSAAMDFEDNDARSEAPAEE
ncbi:Peptide methionine sulfoxide reductase MsrA/MsrB [Posidoniimonas polymericola]|uniref:Multifunctional fusion protein n=1 Tax=Posidoniimonas polymericola TaxID=2528002 RepID=A0A5C5YTK1_9BACT|nr:peptide-methionine (S)-S-oxide reductase MsrA [Posidoniimonas polymericola]TWT77987.1 Peptide methionine sulfoxide reductase MsrA/MsrB [Posidoniimonas polymericola]